MVFKQQLKARRLRRGAYSQLASHVELRPSKKKGGLWVAFPPTVCVLQNKERSPKTVLQPGEKVAEVKSSMKIIPKGRTLSSSLLVFYS